LCLLCFLCTLNPRSVHKIDLLSPKQCANIVSSSKARFSPSLKPNTLCAIPSSKIGLNKQAVSAFTTWIIICPGVTLGSLGVVMLDDRVFEIASTDPDHPLTEHKAKGVAEALRRQDMFDEIKTEPRGE
jgi:hypothetical protein